MAESWSNPGLCVDTPAILCGHPATTILLLTFGQGPSWEAVDGKILMTMFGLYALLIMSGWKLITM